MPRALFITVAGLSFLCPILAQRALIDTIIGGGIPQYPFPDSTTDWRSFPFRIADLAIDSNGSIFIAAQNRVYRADPKSGILQRIAGTGLDGFSGAGGPALQATIGGSGLTPGSPRMYVNKANDLFLTDGPRIRKIDSRSGIISSIAGNGSSTIMVGQKATQSGLQGTIANGSLSGPAADSAGNVYFADFSNLSLIYRVDAVSGILSIFAGYGTSKSGADGTLAASAQLGFPGRFLFDEADNLFFWDSYGGASLVREVVKSSGLLTNSRVTDGYNIEGMARSKSGEIYFSSFLNNSSINILHSGRNTIEQIAGGPSRTPSGDGGLASSATFNFATSVAVDPDGNLLVCDIGAGTIRKLTFVTGNEPLFGPNSIVNAASLLPGGVAPGSVASIFGDALAPSLQSPDAGPLPTQLNGTTVQLTDAAGQKFQAPLQFVAPGQINFILPANMAPGAAQLTVTRQGSVSRAQPVTILAQAPALFSANANGTGVAAAVALYLQADGSSNSIPVFTYDSKQQKSIFNPLPIPDSNTVYLTLYGTGLNGADAASVQVSVGGIPIPVLYAGPQGTYSGLDQINVGPLPTSVKVPAGVKDVVLMIGSRKANLVQIGTF